MALGEKSFFWDRPEGELTAEELAHFEYSGQDFAAFYESLYTTGIVPVSAITGPDSRPEDSLGSSLAVVAGDGLQVVVSTGAAMIKGRPYLASLPVKLNVADSAVTDIVLRMDLQTQTPKIGLAARIRPTGETLENSIRHDSLVHELAIASVDIPQGTVQVTPLMITDQRLNTTAHPTDGKPVSGLCRSIPNMETKGIWEDYTRLEEYVKKTWAAFLTASADEWAVYFSGKQTEFEAWFANLSAILEGDVAANLAAQIETHKADAVVHITAAERAAWNAKASPARTEYHTLTAAGWAAQEDETSTQVITLTGTTIVGDPPINIGETPGGMTAELLDAISAAKFLPTSFTANTVTVTAFGTPPAVDVPIYITVAD